MQSGYDATDAALKAQVHCKEKVDVGSWIN